MIPASARTPAIDIARGFAVMGILTMNIIAFALPEAAYGNPRAWGGTSVADIVAWAVSFVLFDGKMRGLFSMLFGASMLIVMDRAEMTGGDGRKAQAARATVLFLIGIAHYLLLWWGDILALYAVVGMIAMLCAGKQPIELVKLAFLAFAVHFVIVMIPAIAAHHGHYAASHPGATHASITHYSALLEGLSAPGSPSIAEEVTRMRGSFAGIAGYKLEHIVGWALGGFQYLMLDTFGFMLLGMAMLKGGFLTGGWPAQQYWQTARHCFLIGLPPMIGLAIWAIASGFDTVTTFGAVFAWSFPFRIPLTVGWAALILWIAVRYSASAGLARIGAVGRLALSNYLGTSLLMTALFYGWGLGLFGMVGRAELYAVVGAVWALMLLWSPLWLRAFHFGPVEWVWRSVAQRRMLPMRRTAEAA
ncbi:DUF418 domain-containing protein [Sphingobium subterraneum]|nr:DUF418 domain-containing protein [Sphingobium subterraneum]